MKLRKRMKKRLLRLGLKRLRYQLHKRTQKRSRKLLLQNRNQEGKEEKQKHIESLFKLKENA